MNDRLADLQDETPAWAIEGTVSNGGGAASYDIEMASVPSPSTTSAAQTPSGVPSGPSWLSNGSFDDFQEPKLEQETNGVNPQQPPSENQEQNEMDRFFQNIDRIKSSIESITAATKRIGDMNLEAFSANESGEKRLSAEMGPLIQETNRLAKATKDTLSVIKTENKQFEEDKTLKHADMR